ncbi:sulfonate ABC transporter substrate-binding protein [Planktothricoides sp. SR001]|uniref:ABC transporter substrate-binding protein n=1 Tax=Planktothricoides sp. SR001 TaxID=1705388 RepID=UPI0006C6BB98|nr:ABC transporter substrate-binding protein [Planktothricoides sp. SR001]KOR37523.1 sulfonate ABC transporter substrate-binding protein [Planktothricoides sp. SR001]
MIKRRQFFVYSAGFLFTLTLAVSCGYSQNSPKSEAPITSDRPVVLGYSSWAGWWPWAIAQEEGIFTANGLNVQLKWFDGYLESLQAFSAGQLDANCQTLNDTIAFAPNSINGQVVVLVNDNSAGNDKIIVAENINTIQDLKGKKVALEEGLVDDFLLSFALEKNEMSRKDIQVVNLETGAAAAAFAAGQVDAVGAFPPFWLTALKRKGSKELLSSAEFPGAIPDLLVVSQKLVNERPEVVQGLVKTWFDIREFMQKNSEKADAIMAKRANVTVEEFQLFKQGTKFFTVEDNLEAFAPGNTMKNMPYAAQEMTNFMLEVGLIKQAADLTKLFDDRFIKAYANSRS